MTILCTVQMAAAALVVGTPCGWLFRVQWTRRRSPSGGQSAATGGERSSASTGMASPSNASGLQINVYNPVTINNSSDCHLGHAHPGSEDNL